jgi:hypothetical protein
MSLKDGGTPGLLERARRNARFPTSAPIWSCRTVELAQPSALGGGPGATVAPGGGAGGSATLQKNAPRRAHGHKRRRGPPAVYPSVGAGATLAPRGCLPLSQPKKRGADVGAAA